MLISLIAAVARNGVIGKDNTLPWHLPSDLAYFRRTTIGHHVIMGRKTFEEFGIGKPLPKRTNVVITRHLNRPISGCYLVGSLNDAFDFARNNGETEAFVIGGGQIYQLALPLAQRIYLTYIEAEPDGDTFFPIIDPKEWREIKREEHPADERNPYEYAFAVLERVV